MRVLVGINAVLALVLELALLVAAVAVGASLPGPVALRVAAAIVLPLAVVAIWAVRVAPRALHRAPERQRLLIETVLFALGVLGLAAVGLVGWAVALAVLAAARLVLGVRLRRV